MTKHTATVYPSVGRGQAAVRVGAAQEMACAKDTGQKSPEKQDFCKIQMRTVPLRIPYFKTCQLDFYVCDPEGEPRIPVLACWCYYCLDSCTVSELTYSIAGEVF